MPAGNPLGYVLFPLLLLLVIVGPFVAVAGLFVIAIRLIERGNKDKREVKSNGFENV